MAHDPKLKAKCAADLMAGKTIEEVHESRGVSIPTLKRWSAKLSKPENDTKAIPVSVSEQGRQNQFDTLLRSFLIGTLEMLNAWVTLLSDPAFVKEKPSAANELGATVLDRADRLVTLLRPGDSGTAAEVITDELPRVAN